jgi:stringent starvation protein B
VTDSTVQQPALPPKRPYLLRALHQWMIDNNQTPYLVVDAAHAGVVVPEEHVQEGRITLNLSYSATSNLAMGNDEICFDARFGGVARRVFIPMPAVLGIYARESGEGLVFPPDEYQAAADADPGKPDPDPPDPPSPRRPSLKVVK